MIEQIHVESVLISGHSVPASNIFSNHTEILSDCQRANGDVIPNILKGATFNLLKITYDFRLINVAVMTEKLYTEFFITKDNLPLMGNSGSNLFYWDAYATTAKPAPHNLAHNVLVSQKGMLSGGESKIISGEMDILPRVLETFRPGAQLFCGVWLYNNDPSATATLYGTVGIVLYIDWQWRTDFAIHRRTPEVEP